MKVWKTGVFLPLLPSRRRGPGRGGQLFSIRLLPVGDQIPSPQPSPRFGGERESARANSYASALHDNRNAVVARSHWRKNGRNRVAVQNHLRTMTQGSACRATLGWRLKSRWDSGCGCARQRFTHRPSRCLRRRGGHPVRGAHFRRDIAAKAFCQLARIQNFLVPPKFAML